MTFTSRDRFAEDDLDAPSTRGASRRWWVVGILGCAAMLAGVVWFAWSATAGRVSWQTRSYDIVDATSVIVTFDVHRPADVAVTCRLKAMNTRFGSVGNVDVVVPAGPQRSVTSTGTIRTTTQAVTGIVERCEKL